MRARIGLDWVVRCRIGLEERVTRFGTRLEKVM